MAFYMVILAVKKFCKAFSKAVVPLVLVVLPRSRCFVPAAALLILQPAAAGAGVVAANFGYPHRLSLFLSGGAFTLLAMAGYSLL